jgi:dUTP pyrophosphatase
MEVKIINRGGCESPAYATSGASGLDIRAALPQSITLQPMERKLIPTGLYMELPSGYEAQIRPRSGLALKQGLTCLNTPGTIDSDYRGEIKVLLINLSDEAQQLQHNDRIAQMVISKVEHAELLVVQQLNNSDRGDGGFGHTGIK